MKTISIEASWDQFAGLNDAPGKRETITEQLKATVNALFLLLYDQMSYSSMYEAQACAYLNCKIPTLCKKLSPTNENLQIQLLTAHMMMMQWEAAVSKALPAPPQFLDVVICVCIVYGTACSTV